MPAEGGGRHRERKRERERERQRENTEDKYLLQPPNSSG